MRKHLQIWILITLLVPTLACGLIGGGNEEAAPDPVEAEAEAPAEEVTEVEDSTETEVEAETEAPSESNASTEEENDTEAMEAEAVESTSDQTETEKVELADISDLDSLSSYRVSFAMEFDGESGGQPTNGKINVLLETNQELAATHLAMDMEGGTVEELGGLNRLEVYELDNTIYMYNDIMGGEWISMPATDDEVFTQGFFSPNENLQMPDTANCALTPETINGIAAKMCTFDDADLQDSSDAEYDKAEGKVWLAEDGGYVVKYEVDIEGFKPSETDQAGVDQAGLFDFGDISISYELLEVNTDITIELPAEAQEAEGLDFGDLMEDDAPVEPDVPVLDDAEDLFSVSGITTYVSASSIEDAVEFYRQSLPDEGWSEDAESALITDDTTILSFEKDGTTLTLTISKEGENQISVSLISL